MAQTAGNREALNNRAKLLLLQCHAMQRCAPTDPSLIDRETTQHAKTTHKICIPSPTCRQHAHHTTWNQTRAQDYDTTELQPMRERNSCLNKHPRVCVCLSDLWRHYFSLISKRPAHSQIRNLQHASFVDEHVAGLQIAMRNPLTVKKIQTAKSHLSIRLSSKKRKVRNVTATAQTIKSL